ncbi:MAG TPA: amidohydrolase, partial [Opitutaceae bacterium]|nr:amidohydrolase [Opitutaceae bacterium]
MPTIADCVVLHGPELTPFRCRRFTWERDTLKAIELEDPVQSFSSGNQGTRVIIPGLYNSH